MSADDEALPASLPMQSLEAGRARSEGWRLM